MANFVVKPEPFLVGGMHVDHGWNRPSRARVALGGEPTWEHEDYAIVSVNPMPHANHMRQALNAICEFLEHNQRVEGTCNCSLSLTSRFGAH
jgi:hypothetical protein